jgi:2-polyprenyl-3-methyl-5-hydroxy-6-metoxy-1,4-benzoquinol methylase
MDHFADKASSWDEMPIPQQIARGVEAALRRHVALRPTMTVLDFGAGTGLLAERIAPDVQRVLAVDVSPAMLSRLGEKAELQGRVETRCQDLLTTPLEDKVDLVVSAMAMHHVRDTFALLKALREHLVAGGGVALADLDTEPGDFHPPGVEGVHHHGFDRQALGDLLRAVGFDDVRFDTACTVARDGVPYGIFLVTARRA